jgi:hypothetical protein
MQNTTFKYKANVGSLLLSKSKTCAQFSQNRRQPAGCKHEYGFLYALSPKKCNNMLKEISFLVFLLHVTIKHVFF